MNHSPQLHNPHLYAAFQTLPLKEQRLLLHRLEQVLQTKIVQPDQRLRLPCHGQNMRSAVAMPCRGKKR